MSDLECSVTIVATETEMQPDGKSTHRLVGPGAASRMQRVSPTCNSAGIGWLFVISATVL